MAEWTQMMFVLRMQMGRRNHMLDGVQIAHGNGAVLRGRQSIVKYRDTVRVSCAKTAEPIEMLFRTWTRVCSKKHGSAHWRHMGNDIELSTCAAVQPVVKLL